MAVYRFPSNLSLHLDVTISNGSIQKVVLLPQAKGLTVAFFGSSFDAFFYWFEAYAKGKPSELPLPLAFSSLSSFTQKVLRELRKIPFGKQMSYKQIAQAIGHPQAARAVGNACRVNPFPLIIPCHRVTQTNRGIGGFAYGTACKMALLKYEENAISE